MPDSLTAADVLVKTLINWGVEVVFGLPGDGINGIMEALRTRQERIRFVQVRHEESAAFMACAWAKWTGKLGCCLATSGPGGIHLLNGLYDAKMDGQPVVAITGMPYHDLVSTFTQQDVELDKIFDNVAVYNARVMGPSHVENVADLACRAAIGYKGVAHITFPNDFQHQPVEKAMRSPRNKPDHESSVPGRGLSVPPETALDRAAEVLNAGSKVAIIAGRGALGAREELERVAEILAAPIGRALLGLASVPDDSPYTTGSIGYLGTDPSQAMLDGCDTLLLVGTSFPYIEYLPKPGQARCVQIDTDPLRIGLRYPAEVGLVGDSRATLASLVPLLRRQTNRTFLEQAQANRETWRAQLDREAAQTTNPMKPQVIANEVGKQAPANALISSDSGTSTFWWARYVPVKEGQQHTVSGLLASMACGLPYAIAAQIAYPDRPCIAFVGDGGFSMLMGEFITAVKYKLPIKIVILNNGAFGYIRWEQMLYLGNPEFGIELQSIDFAAFARACGATGFRIEKPEDCERILAEAFVHPGPVIVDAVVDGLEPTTPPKLSQEQAKHFFEALDKGQPHGETIAHTSLAQKARQTIEAG